MTYIKTTLQSPWISLLAIIRKGFYALTLIKELGVIIGSGNSNKTYEKINATEENNITDGHARFLNIYWLYVNEDSKYLPNIYWLPKLHKNPTKALFIIGTFKCFLKPLSKYITATLKILFHQIQNCNNHSRQFSGIYTFWTIFNNYPLIKDIGKINKHSCPNFILLFLNFEHKFSSQ